MSCITEGVDDTMLAAARRAFERYGYVGTTLARIAEEAGVSRVTLHRHGVTKELLLGRLAEAATTRYRAAMWEPLTAPGPAAERLERALSTLCDQAEEHMALLVALRAQSDGIFHRAEEEEALTRDVFTEPLERLLRDGVLDGTLRDLDPIETATTLFNLVGWTYVHLRTGHGWGPPRARAAVLEPVLRGVLAT